MSSLSRSILASPRRVKTRTSFLELLITILLIDSVEKLN
jgi:hypothetical protein